MSLKGIDLAAPWLPCLPTVGRFVSRADKPNNHLKLTGCGTVLRGSRLVDSFTRPWIPGSPGRLTVGARALTKHSHRDQTTGFWGEPTGSEQAKNEIAFDALKRLLADVAWMNTHFLPGQLEVSWHMAPGLPIVAMALESTPCHSCDFGPVVNHPIPSLSPARLPIKPLHRRSLKCATARDMASGGWRTVAAFAASSSRRWTVDTRRDGSTDGLCCHVSPALASASAVMTGVQLTNIQARGSMKASRTVQAAHRRSGG